MATSNSPPIQEEVRLPAKDFEQKFRIIEGKSALDDGYIVFTKTWKASTEKARVLFLHGFSDHSDNYPDFFAYLAGQRGISIYSYDQRGWGRSCLESRSQRGRTGDDRKIFGDISRMLRPLVADRRPVDSVLDYDPTTESNVVNSSSPTNITTQSSSGSISHFRSDSSSSNSLESTPVFLMGHSMGGGLVLSYTSQDPDGLVQYLRGTIAIAPLIALHPASRPFGFNLTLALGRFASKFMPNRQMINRLDPSYLSRNPQKNQEWVDDQLCHDTATLQCLSAMLDRGTKLNEGSWRVAEGKHEDRKTRVLVVHGTGDKVNDAKASENWVEKYCVGVLDKGCWLLDGWFHNLHIEPGHAIFQQGVGNWILQRSVVEHSITDGISPPLMMSKL